MRRIVVIYDTTETINMVLVERRRERRPDGIMRQESIRAIALGL